MITARQEAFGDPNTRPRALGQEPGTAIGSLHGPGTRYFAVRKSEVPGPWVFDHPFYILLNLAIGGHFVGAPNEFTPFPQSMVVDWVRVYQRSD